MIGKFTIRENKIMETLQKFVDSNLNFICVGGYAVSAYKHRFSIDADIIIKSEDRAKFETILVENGFTKTITKKLEHVYASEFMRYETKDELPVSIDVLIDGIGSRTTDTSFSFEELNKFCKKRKIIGTEKEVSIKVPDKEIIIVLKLHSGRLTDFRDVVALSRDIDIKLINQLIWRGQKQDIVKDNIRKLISLIEKKEFIDSFKGVFVEKKYDIDIESIKKIGKILEK